MKRYGNLFPKVVDTDNIKDAIRNASLGKRNYSSVKPYLTHMETTVMRIQTMLITDTYVPSHIRETKINEHGKHRIITSSKFFPDQIIHWALMNVLAPIFEKSMYTYNLATIPGRGIALGLRKLIQWTRNDPKNTKYVCYMDVHHFYPSINHHVLKVKLTHRFKDKRVLKILFDIIDCYPKGLPLGLYTSQWMANFYLEREDHRIKEKYRVPYFIRYMDDQYLLGPNKKKLHKIQRAVESDLKRIGLQVKPNWQVYKLADRPINALGYKIYPDHVTIRGRNFLKIMRLIRKIYKQHYMSKHQAHSLISYNGFFVYSDSNKIKQIIKHKYGITIKFAKEVIKNG